MKDERIVRSFGHEILGELGGLLVAAIVCVFAAALGLTGLLVRRGVELRKVCNKSEALAAEKGYRLNETWHRDRRRAAWWIAGPIVGWTASYVIIFAVLPIRVSLFSLLGLVPVFLGYFGRFLVPDP